ncbi:hypothetical protein PM082_012162 [Marasmius tenuissimus]|nr:hypothetical protein PM082_012162 [Marasmius tenuissimus]
MYPPIEPHEVSTLKVSEIHTLYYEISGNKEGNPGGPGGGCDAKDRSFFDPQKYKAGGRLASALSRATYGGRYDRSVLLDQRGAGKSNSVGRATLLDPQAKIVSHATFHS